MPQGMTRIGNYAFYENEKITEVVFPAKLEIIGDSAFRGCTSLKGIEFPAGLKTIGSYAFYNCTGMTGDLIIPDSVTVIGSYAFYECHSLDGRLVISESLTEISNSTFDSCSRLTGDLVIPEGITSIGTYAFDHCESLTGNIELPTTLETISSYAFYECSGITGELVIPDKVATLGNYAFYGMGSITSVVFGEGFSNHGSNAFNECSNVTEVTFNSAVPATIGGTTSTKNYNPFRDMDKLETIYVPGESYDAYVSAYSKYVGDSVQFSSDYLNPRVPNFDISQLYSHSVVLKWSAHLNDKVIGYIVYRDGEEIGRTTELTYTDRNLETNQTYQYTVRGYTENGDLTGAGEISVTPKNPEIISIETGHSLNKVSDENSSLTIVMNNNDNHEPFEGKTNSAKLYYVIDHER
ncbi:MAG: leucine-rich repeat protein [Merdibacter sp.]